MRARFLLTAVLGATLAACQTVSTTAPGAVGVERKQQMLVSEAEIAQAAAQSYAQELQKAQAKGVLNTDKALVNRVRAISDRLIPQTVAFRPDAVQWKWEVNVQTTDELNAYCMPGGKIMVYSGLVDRLKLSDDEIATVVGHEMAHALREHSRERISRQYAQQLALTGVAVVTGVGAGAVDLVGAVANVTFQLPHGRAQEAEADRIGLELMARAGFDPRAAADVWVKMASADTSGSKPPEFLSTHPSGESRIQDLNANVPKVMPLYEAARRQ